MPPSPASAVEQAACTLLCFGIVVGLAWLVVELTMPAFETGFGLEHLDGTR